MAFPDLPQGCLALGVLREPSGTGGSEFMHALKIGDVVTATAPVNNFCLDAEGSHALLFAGGIGITPILSMAADLRASAIPHRVHYAGRMQGGLAFISQLRAIGAEALSIHYDSDESRLEIEVALDQAFEDSHIYVCGPAGVIDAVKNCALGIDGFGIQTQSVVAD